MISRRSVFFIGGYEPKTAQAFFERLRRGMRHFESTWGVEVSASDPSLYSPDAGMASVVASGPEGWRVTTDFHFLGLDSIVTQGFARPLHQRLLAYLRTFFDYWLSGTAFAIFARSWRFGLYFLYPFAVTCLFLLAVFFASRAVLDLAGIDVPGLSLVVALLALLPLLATLGNRWSVPHLMDLWSFSLQYLRGRRPDAEAMLRTYAGIVATAVKDGQYDEILFVGHSTGGGLILDLAARSLEADPSLASRAEVSLLTLGSTALKFGLHPAAKPFRKKVQSLVDEPGLRWSEFQCLIDVINFYGTDPVREMGLKPRARDAATAFPLVRKIYLSAMMGPSEYQRMKGRFFRIHYQFISPNTQRYYYDFFMICFGPHLLSSVGGEPGVDIFPQQEAGR